MAGYSDFFFFFPHLYAQIIREFALRCLCQVKTTTEQGEYEMQDAEERAQYHSSLSLCEGVPKQSITNALGLQVYPTAWFISGQIQTVGSI